jgi:Protein of unknown function (DUF3570)
VDVDAINLTQEDHVQADTRSGVSTSGGVCTLGASLLYAAAFALPGLYTTPVQADSAPEHGVMGIRYLHYKDFQPSMDRVQASSPSVHVMMPLAGEWSVDANMVSDSVSGASPRWHTSVSSASHMNDRRTAGDVTATKYLSRGSWSVGAAYSTEHDYISRAVSFQRKWSTEDNNTTFAVGMGLAHDGINPVNGIVSNQSKNTSDYLLGITRVLTPSDLVQFNLTYTRENGYLTDPYKFLDTRPDNRKQTALQWRWNHYHGATEGTSRLSYRYYQDSWNVQSHTMEYAYAQPLPKGWMVTPILRLYTQNSADFYYPPADSSQAFPFPVGVLANPSAYKSADQRLAGFGARTLGLKAEKTFGKDWVVDMRLDRYEQRGSWQLFGTGHNNLEPFQANITQIGVSKHF